MELYILLFPRLINHPKKIRSCWTCHNDADECQYIHSWQWNNVIQLCCFHLLHRQIALDNGTTIIQLCCLHLLHPQIALDILLLQKSSMKCSLSKEYLWRPCIPYLFECILEVRWACKMERQPLCIESSTTSFACKLCTSTMFPFFLERGSVGLDKLEEGRVSCAEDDEDSWAAIEARTNLVIPIAVTGTSCTCLLASANWNLFMFLYTLTPILVLSVRCDSTLV